MEIKGTAVKSIKDFVRDNYPDRYDEWFKSLSKESQFVLNTMLSNGWYPVKEGVIEPTQRIGEMFFDGCNNDKQMSKEHALEVFEDVIQVQEDIDDDNLDTVIDRYQILFKNFVQ